MRAKGLAALPVLEFCESLLAVLMDYARYVMKLAPTGMAAAVLANSIG